MQGEIAGIIKFIWLFKLPTLCDLPPQITSDLLSFQYKDIENEKPIAKGGFGFVSKANYQNKTVVIKKISSESAEDEKLFLKEAKLIDSLRHVNVVGLYNILLFSIYVNARVRCFRFFTFRPVEAR